MGEEELKLRSLGRCREIATAPFHRVRRRAGLDFRRNLRKQRRRALCDAIDGRFLCWLDADTLLFAMYFETYDCHQLYTINIPIKQCCPCLNREGESILLWHHVALGSTVSYSARQDAVAYIGLPCLFTTTVITDADEAPVAVPQIIDLDTGETYVLYENATDFSGELLEYRNRPGQLTWENE